MRPRLIVTIDTECDKTSNWYVRRPLSFESVEEGIGRRLQPLFDSFGVRPTYFLSPEVMCHRQSVALLAGLANVELATHMHGDFIVPQIETWDFAGSVTDDMQFEYGLDLERRKMAVLTEMFAQQFGRRPVSFRAGRFGIGRHTGRILQELGYLADSSVTPHIAWTDKQGRLQPDFRGLPEFPYAVGAEGDLGRPGVSSLLEVPVTVLPARAVPANNPVEPIWLRPWYSDAETLERVVDYVLAQPARNGIARPLVMMFHNVEVMAGASPYPQTAAEVERFLDQLRRTFAYALERGVQASTLAEYRRDYAQSQAAPLAAPQPSQVEANSPAVAPSRSAPPLSPSLDLPPSLIEPILDRHQVQSWFKYVYRERASRWDVWQPCFWLAQHTPREAKILSVGTGVGFNLLWLGRQGFTKLEGFDLDAKAVGAAVDLAAAAGVQARYWVDDGLNPTGLRGRKYDVVECLNWTHLLPNFSLSSLIESYLPYLVDEGVFIIDVIDRAYDQVPGNQWHTADANKPEHERRPTEYLTRMNQAEVSAAFRAKGFKVVARLAEPQKIPKAVYVARRLSATISGADGASAQTSPDKQAQASAAKARVLLIADVPNWIFERHARTLHALLAHQFDFTLGFQGQKFNEDDFDLIYPLEWNLVPAEQIRTPRKWVTGIRSHCAWQPIGLEPVAALLVQKFQRVHAVSRRLQHLFAPRVSGVELLSHGVDTEFFSSRTPADLSGAGKLRLGWAGNRRSGSRKGFEEIIEPLGRIPGVELVFCGYSDRLLTANEMVDFYNSIDAYVCASDFEGNNNSLLEAASMARAIITTDSGTVSEYLRHGESALIVDRRPEAFARAVRQLRDNPSLRLQLGSAASQAVQAFAWRTQATRHADFFRRALTVATQAPVQRHDNAAWLGAEQAARSALQNHPEDVEALRSLAGALFQQAKWVECAQTCHRLLTLQTDDIDVLVVLAEALNQGGDPATAAAALRRVVELQPDNPDAAAALAACQPRAAEAQGPALTPAQEEEISAGMKALEGDDLVSALAHYEAAGRLGPSHPDLENIIVQLRASLSGPRSATPESAAPGRTDQQPPADAPSRPREVGWSFCIITNGKRPAKLLREIESIRALQIPVYEILVGGAPPEGLPADVGQVPAADAARNGRLGEMRNKLTAAARYDRLVVVDDDFIFHSDFIIGIQSLGDDWEIACPRILNPNGTRYWDWATHGGANGHALLDYGQPDDHIYVTGGLCVMKATVADRVKWDDQRGFYMGEDLDFSARLRAAGIRICSNPRSTATHDDGRYTQMGKAIERRSIEVGLPVRWLAPFFNPSGYASEAINFVLPVANRMTLGIYHDNGLTSEKFIAGLPDQERQTLLVARDVFPQIRNGIVVAHNPANGLRRLPDADYHVGRTMFETDRIPPGWAEACNAMDEVWVPSRFNLETFAQAGVHRDKLVVMPGAVDAAFFDPRRHSPLELPNRARFNFLSIFEWSSRKGWDVLLAAYLQEFSAEDDVCLFLRTYLFSKPEGDPRAALEKRIRAYARTLNLGNKPLPRLELLADQVPHSQLPSLYLACDCYVAPSRGEGWGRPQHEAMLMERPVIATNWSANTEFMARENAYLLDYEVVEAKGLEPELWHYKGHRWANPSLTHLRELMRRVEQNPAEARQKGMAARRQMAAQYSREAVAERVVHRLQEIERQFFSPVLPAALARQLHAPAAPAPAKPRSIAFEGAFLDYGSLSHVNRELVKSLSHGHGLRISPVGPSRTVSGPATDPELQRIGKLLVGKAPKDSQITVRHSWPPVWEKPQRGQWVLMQPWEYGALPRDWAQRLSEVDQIWVYSTYLERIYLEAGVPPAKVKLVPLGIDPKRMGPGAEPLELETTKTFKFLFVGGTIQRKGPDVLLKAYLQSFRRSDDVCLVIKDFGGSSFYAGQTLEKEIRAAQADPDAPEILYLDKELKPEQMVSLYASCDCLVHPYRSEGFGLPVLEAMACGLPVIVTGGGATDDFATDEYAVRIPAERHFIGDTVGGLKLISRGWWLEPSLLHLKLALRQMIASPEAGRALGQKASEYVRREWTWDNTATNAARWLHELALQAEKAEELHRQKVKGEVPNFRLPNVALIGDLRPAREYLAAGDLTAAWSATDDAISCRPFHPEGYLLLAEIAVRARDHALARQCLQKAKGLAPRWKQINKVSARIPSQACTPTTSLPAPRALAQRAPKLSLCLIAKNEEKMLPRCLASVQGLADEIILVDTGSTDDTVAIARSFGAQVYHLPWTDDFSAPRNEALKHATGDWVLSLDADEELPPDQHALLRESMQEAGVIAARLPIIDVGLEGNGHSYVPRLYRNAPALCYVGRIHEQVFATVEARREQWNLENKFGRAVIRHYGYDPVLVKDRDKIARNLRLLERAVEEFPHDVNLLMNLGLELMRAGQQQPGMDAYSEALDVMSCRPVHQTPPELKEALYTQFVTHLIGLKLFGQAIDVLTLAEEKEGTLTASMHFLKGLALLETKQYQPAAIQMRSCLAKRHQPALAPVHPEIRKAGPSHCLAICLRNLNQPEEALECYRQALQDAPEAIYVRLEFAEFLAQRGDFVAGLTTLHQAIGDEPKNTRLWKLGGEIALRQPATRDFALDWTEESLKQAPAVPELERLRAEALMLSGQTAAAAPLWQHLAAQGNPSDVAAAVLCAVVSDAPARFSLSGDDANVSREFVQWYRKLVQFEAEEVVGRLHERLPKLSLLLPKAADLIDRVTAAALAG